MAIHPDGVQQGLGHFSGRIGTGKGNGQLPLFQVLDQLGITFDKGFVVGVIVRCGVFPFIGKGRGVSVRFQGRFHHTFPEHLLGRERHLYPVNNVIAV